MLVVDCVVFDALDVLRECEDGTGFRGTLNAGVGGPEGTRVGETDQLEMGGEKTIAAGGGETGETTQVTEVEGGDAADAGVRVAPEELGTGDGTGPGLGSASGAVVVILGTGGTMLARPVGRRLLPLLVVLAVAGRLMWMLGMEGIGGSLTNEGTAMGDSASPAAASTGTALAS